MPTLLQNKIPKDKQNTRHNQDKKKDPTNQGVFLEDPEGYAESFPHLTSD